MMMPVCALPDACLQASRPEPSGPGGTCGRRHPVMLALLSTAWLPAVAWASDSGITTLSDVVVSATGYEQALADAPASISVLTSQELAGKYYRDVSDSLQDIPGVSVEGGANGRMESTSITIRGMAEAYVLFLVDGKPLGDSGEAFYNGFGAGSKINMLPPASAIERIEVIRGPMSSLYGSSALGGVINIITRKHAERWQGSVTVDGVLQESSQSGNSHQARFHVSGPLVAERLSLSVHGSHFQRNEDRIQGGYPRKQRNEATTRLAWRLSQRQQLELEAGHGSDRNNRTLDGTGADSQVSNKRPHYGLTHDIDWGQGRSTRSFLTHEKVEVENNGYDSAYQALQANSKTVIGLSRQMLTVGVDLKQEKTRHMPLRFPGSVRTNLSRWQAALFAEDEFAVSERLSLTGGLRLDRNEHYGNKLTPRLYAVYRLTPAWALKGGVGGGYKTPSLKQADDDIVEIAARGAAWDKGNSNLRPESSTNYELGTTWTPATGMSLALTYYNTRFKDKISTEVICNSPTNTPACEYNGEVRRRINQYVNLDRARLQGLEVAFSAPLGPVKLRSGYTWSDSEITHGRNIGRPLNNLPRHAFSIGADWQASDPWAVWGKLRYRSRTQEDGTLRHPAYTMVDIGTTYDLSRNLQLFGGLYNLLDKTIELDQYGKALDGRRLYLGLTARF